MNKPYVVQIISWRVLHTEARQHADATTVEVAEKTQTLRRLDRKFP